MHGLREADGVEDRAEGVPHRVWRDRAGAVKVELYAIPGLAHGTPIDTGAPGDRGVGHAMPFILESSVSSTWRIARSWDLVEDSPDTARAKSPARVPMSPHDIFTYALRAHRVLRGGVRRCCRCPP